MSGDLETESEADGTEYPRAETNHDLGAQDPCWLPLLLAAVLQLLSPWMGALAPSTLHFPIPHSPTPFPKAAWLLS
jgi:hypothetical protein